MEEFLFTSGFSWTMAKALPYAAFVLLGLIVVVILRRIFKRKLVRILSLLAFPIPFLIYFAIHPIYQGDFSNNFRIEASIDDVPEGELIALAMPGCPFCYAAIDDLKKLKQRTGSEQIRFYLFAKDSLAAEWYQEKAGDDLKIEIFPGDSPIGPYTRGHFPAFIYRKGKDTYIWSNDAFGVRAKDWIESRLDRKS